jgi:3-oxoacyl-[acyl-carrier protein] reductase
MKDRIVLVTGSSRGIGFEIAKEYGLLGAKVIINCKNSEAELNAAKASLLGMGIEVISVMGDVSGYEEAEKVVNTALSLGGIDILVNNAGISYVGLFTEMKDTDIGRVITNNINSVVNCSHLALPSMIKRKEGRIINISSVWGVSGASCEAVYSGTKGFVNSFTKALAKETGPSGVYINAIACGIIDTGMNHFLTDAEADELRENIALMRFGTPKDVVKLCIYLTKAEYMTGQILVLDGGMF